MHMYLCVRMCMVYCGIIDNHLTWATFVAYPFDMEAIRRPEDQG